MFNQSGDMFTLAQSTSNQIENLPAGTYEVKFNMEIGYYLSRRSDLQVYGKVYGNSHARASKIFNTFNRRAANNKNTGVLLSGEKGSGKTFVWKILAGHCIAAGIPVLLVNGQFAGPDFVSFMAALKQKMMIVFDEYEKVYSEQAAQESLLPLFDGIGSDNKMFLFTVNGMQVNEFMLNRPSRVFYHYVYSKLELEFVKEYCADMNVPAEISEKIQMAWSLSSVFNFDILQSIVEETMAYPETSPVDCILDMNFDPVVSRSYYDVTVKINGVLVMTTFTNRMNLADWLHGDDIKLTGKESECKAMQPDIRSVFQKNTQIDGMLMVESDYPPDEYHLIIRKLPPVFINKDFTHFKYEQTATVDTEAYSGEGKGRKGKSVESTIDVFIEVEAVRSSYTEPKLIDLLR